MKFVKDAVYYNTADDCKILDKYYLSDNLKVSCQWRKMMKTPNDTKTERPTFRPFGTIMLSCARSDEEKVKKLYEGFRQQDELVKNILAKK